MSKESHQVVVTGSVAYDIIFARKTPLADDIVFDKNRKISVSLFAHEHEMLFGGTGANIAYTMALLEMHPILLASLFKGDANFQIHLDKTGIQSEFLHKSGYKTAVFSVTNDREGNQIGTFGGGAMFDSECLLIASLLQDIPKPFVIISPHDPKQMLVQVNECQEFGLRMCFDVGQQAKNGSEALLRAGLDACEVLIANESEMSLIAQRLGIQKSDITSSVPVCVTTLGSQGSLIEGKKVSTPIEVGVAKIREFRDPTGAGDAYRGGFFRGYLAGLPLEICGKMGAISSAYAVENFGGQEHSFSVDEFQTRFEENFGIVLNLK